MIPVYADENVSPRIVEGLRRRGVRVVTPADEGLLGVADREHFDRAIALGAILLTADSDHLALASEAAATGNEHPSVVYFHIAWCDPAEVIRETCRVAVALAPTEVRNRLWFVRWTRKPKSR